MGGAELAMHWLTLADLTRSSAALPPEGFAARFPAPFLLEINPENVEVAGGETRDFDPQKALSQGATSPSLNASLIINFGEGETFLLGRGEASQLRVSHASVSERHCVFERVGTLWSIRDAGSRNGTWLNGRRLGEGEQSPLKFGTKIMAGEAQFLFLSPDDCYDLIQELSKEPRIRPLSLGKYRATFKSASLDELRQQYPGPFLIVQAPKTPIGPASAPVSSNTITLTADQLKKGVDQNVADAVFNLGGHNLVRIGRASVTQIHLPLPAISNLHAALVRDKDAWYIQDLGAKNGTYVWGERLEGKKKLSSGTEVMLGNIKSIFFELEDLVTYTSHRDTLIS
mgnify:CR=1 FL=1